MPLELGKLDLNQPFTYIYISILFPSLPPAMFFLLFDAEHVVGVVVNLEIIH